ncbi:hypothetical protein ACF0H5_021198 [Mactra antiquata]
MTTRLMMRALRVAQFGGPEVLKVEANIQMPVPSSSQVLVEVKAAGLNPVDTYIRTGTYAVKPTLPYIPGSDAAGIVKEVGDQVTKFKPGDRVFVLKAVTGGCAEFTLGEESFVGYLPETLSFQQGAGIGIPYFTAYRALCIKGRDKVKSSNTVLIHGASGAVGLACVQIAVSKGMKVIGTAGSPEGLELVRKEGATSVFNHREKGYMEKILESTGGNGPDLIIEMLANVNLDADMQIVNKYGIIVIVGNRGQIEVNPRLLMGKDSTVTGMILMNATQEEWSEMHSGITDGLKAGWIKPTICTEYDLNNAPKAHEEIINNSGALGKRVFVI